MHKNGIWIAFFSSVLLVTLWFGGKGAFALFDYYKLSEHVDAHVKSIEIKELSRNQFILHANFNFYYNGMELEGGSDLGALFPNRYAAEKGALFFKERQNVVWFSKKHPEKGVLEKKFPYKKTFSAGILFSLSLYFLFLGMYVAKKRV